MIMLLHHSASTCLVPKELFKQFYFVLVNTFTLVLKFKKRISAGSGSRGEEFNETKKEWKSPTRNFSASFFHKVINRKSLQSNFAK